MVMGLFGWYVAFGNDEVVKNDGTVSDFGIGTMPG